MAGTVNSEYKVNVDGVIQSAVIQQIESIMPLSTDAGEVKTVIR